MGLKAADIGNVLKLLQRVQGIQGAEVMTIAMLIGKLTAEYERLGVSERMTAEHVSRTPQAPAESPPSALAEVPEAEKASEV